MVDLDEDYIKNLYSDLPEKNLEVYKYPKGKGLRLSDPEDRKQILFLLHKLREYALSIILQDWRSHVWIRSFIDFKKIWCGYVQQPSYRSQWPYPK